MQRMKRLQEPWNSLPRMILQVGMEVAAWVVQEQVRALCLALDLVARLRLKQQF